MPTKPTKTLRILLVDDSELVRRGIRAVIEGRQQDLDFTIVGEADSVASAVAAAEKLQPDLVLLDIRLPDGSGFDACKSILKANPAVRVLVLTSFSNDDFVCESIVAGAHGYLMKELEPAALIDACRRVAAGDSVLGPGLTERVLNMVRHGGNGAKGLASLSKQERRVLVLVAEGKTNKEIGVALDLSDNTVKNYLVSVFDKLQVKRRSQAAAIYVQGREQQ